MTLPNRVLKYLVLVAAILFVVAISSFWFSSSSFSEKDVTLSLDAPVQVSSGDEVTYKITYANATKTTLYNLNFLFFYPQDATILKDGNTIQGQTDSFKVDQLAPGQKGEKEFKVFLVGDKGNIKSAKVTLSFKSGSLQSSFEKSATIATTIVAMPIDLTLVSPPNATPGQAINYILDYRNQSSDDISDLLIQFSYPDGFSVQDSTPAPGQGNNVWSVPLLKKGSGSRISIQGTLDGKEGDSKSVEVQLKRKIGTTYIDYEKASSVTLISSPLMGLDVLVNESNNYSAYPGDDLRYTLKYSNNSNLNLSGLNLSVQLEGDMYDFSSLNTNGGFFDDSTKTILWNSSTMPDFINLSPGAKGQITFHITLNRTFPSGGSGSSRDRFVKATAKLSTPNVPPNSNAEELAVFASAITKIGTQPSISETAYYNDPAFGSFGPMPLQVGQETAFTVHWQIINPGNDIGGAVLSGKLPSGVFWMDQTSTDPGNQEPVFNPNTQQVSWSFPVVPYGVGIFTPKYEASFRIKIKPSSIQKGTEPYLLQGVQFTGTDNFTKQSIIINKKDMTTNDIFDMPRQGTVQ